MTKTRAAIAVLAVALVAQVAAGAPAHACTNPSVLATACSSTLTEVRADLTLVRAHLDHPVP
jgi:hypothetical protein